MFRAPCGRHKESPIWNFYHYDASTDKSRCTVIVAADGSSSKRECGRLLSGKNPTNLKVHLKTFHKPEFLEYETLNNALQKPAVAAAKLQSPGTSSNAQLASMHNQQGIKQFACQQKSAGDVGKQQELLVNMFVGTGLSTRLIDHKDFRALFN
jgi:hypothetical protein